MKLMRNVEPPSEDPAIVSVNEAFDRLRVASLCSMAIVVLAMIAGGLWARDILDQQGKTRVELAQLRSEVRAQLERHGATADYGAPQPQCEVGISRDGRLSYADCITARSPSAIATWSTYSVVGSGLTNILPTASGTYLVNSAITDDGSTITVDLDQTDRQVVVKRPGTNDSVTVSKAPVQLSPVRPGVFSPPLYSAPMVPLTHPAEK